MRLLLVHNRYQKPGGEDTVFEAERALLERKGHVVVTYERDNDEIEGNSVWQRADLARRTIWATDSAASIRQILASGHFDAALFYNTFPLVSPSAYYVCESMGVPVIQVLPNFRLICPGATLHRDGRICEKCVAKTVPWWGAWHGCYRNSRIQSTVVTAMLAIHGFAGTWRDHVTTYIALTEFARQKFIEGGLPAGRIVVKPNFIYPDPGSRVGDSGFALFLGRLSREKGIATLMRAWETLPAVPLKVAGDGPLMPLVAESAARRRGPAAIEAMGWRTREEVLDLLKRASFLVVPSEWYEGFPLTIVEAFACGVPVIGSRLGGVGEVVRHGESGLHFQPGDATDLAATAESLWCDEALRRKLGRGARTQFEAHYTADRTYETIMEIISAATA
jgi:glycosyltransferase involved in cell wall biosynthesis